MRKARKIRVTVPAGVEEGMRLRIVGEGSVGRKGGPSGDLYVMMSVKPHGELRREGQTVYSDVSVRLCWSDWPAFTRVCVLRIWLRPAGVAFERMWLQRCAPGLLYALAVMYRLCSLDAITHHHECMQVSYIDAILGTTKKVTTVDGLVDLKVPAGTQPGTTLLLSKRGAPSPNGSSSDRGNHLVKVKVTIPKKLSSEERKLIEELKNQSGDGRIKVGPFKL